MSDQKSDPGAAATIAIRSARQNLTEVISQARHWRRGIVLTNRGRPQAAVFPHDLWLAVEAAGGVDAAIELLRRHS